MSKEYKDKLDWDSIQDIVIKHRITENGSYRDKTIIIFGAGVYGQISREYLEKNDIKVQFYSDNSTEKQGTVIDGLEVICPKDIHKLNNPFVFIAAKHHVCDVANQLEKLGIEYISIDRFCIQRQYEEFRKIKDWFEDEKSHNTYVAILFSMLIGNTKVLQNVMEDKQFFALSNFRGNSGEIFIDAGAYVGDTVEQFIWNSIGQFNKIYAFEPGDRQFDAMQYRIRRLEKEWAIEDKKIECIKAGLGEKTEQLIYCINEGGDSSNNFIQISEEKEKTKEVIVYSIDEFLQGKKVTFLKADIEGFELEMLRGAVNTIKEWKPKLAISVYHRPDDIVEIINYIKSIVPEYKIAIRQHSHMLLESVVYCWRE